MKTLVEHLSQYAFYHQDKRNIATHFIGIPMIVVAIATLLSRPHFTLADITLTPAILLVVASCLFYLRLNIFVGVLMSALLGLSIWAGEFLAAQSTTVWLSAGIGLFVVGWIFQFVGHYFEGKKPAFLDDISGLIIGPLFVLAEFLFIIGMKKNWEKQIHAFCLKQNKAQSA